MQTMYICKIHIHTYIGHSWKPKYLIENDIFSELTLNQYLKEVYSEAPPVGIILWLLFQDGVRVDSDTDFSSQYFYVAITFKGSQLHW